MRHQHLLIRRLGTLLRSRMSKSNHLMQVVTQEHRGNCLPPSGGCGPGCLEAQELVTLTEPFMVTAKRPASRPMRMVVLKRPQRRPRPVEAMRQPDLFETQEAV